MSKNQNYALFIWYESYLSTSIRFMLFLFSLSLLNQMLIDKRINRIYRSNQQNENEVKLHTCLTLEWHNFLFWFSCDDSIHLQINFIAINDIWMGNLLIENVNFWSFCQNGFYRCVFICYKSHVVNIHNLILLEPFCVATLLIQTTHM